MLRFLRRRYSICIRAAAGFCCVQYMVCQGVTNPFSLDTTTTMAMQDDFCLTVDHIGISSEQLSHKVPFANTKIIFFKKIRRIHVCQLFSLSVADSGSTCNQGNNLATDSRYCGLTLSNFNMAVVGVDSPVCGENFSYDMYRAPPESPRWHAWLSIKKIEAILYSLEKDLT